MSNANLLRGHLDVPYIVLMESIERDGNWVRRATHPELPGCVVEADTPIDAVERLDELRVRRIRELLESHQPVPAPRAPLRWVRPPRTTDPRKGEGG